MEMVKVLVLPVGGKVQVKEIPSVDALEHVSAIVGGTHPTRFRMPDMEAFTAHYVNYEHLPENRGFKGVAVLTKSDSAGNIVSFSTEEILWWKDAYDNGWPEKD